VPDPNITIRNFFIAVPQLSLTAPFPHSVSLRRYLVREELAAGGCALVEWRLETGRTHQIRVHAKHLNTPLFGDDTYGGGAPQVRVNPTLVYVNPTQCVNPTSTRRSSVTTRTAVVRRRCVLTLHWCMLTLPSVLTPPQHAALR
jgi:hypothetical protein